MKRLILGLCRISILVAAFSAAAAQPQFRPQIEFRTPVENPVALESVSVQADIRGSLAMTSVDMVFYNPNARILEGELQFPLLDGQRVVGLAMDLNGKLRESVPVDKARGQEVFEEVTRAQIDPALLQVTAGNNYRMRVYPIPARGHKRVVIRFAETLAANGGNRVYRLPLEYAVTLASLELTVQVADAAPKTLRSPAGIGELAFHHTGSFYSARVNREQFPTRGVLELAVPVTARPQVYTQAVDGETYFYAELPVTATTAPRQLPKVLGLIWDSSGSGAGRDHEREFALLDAYFRRARDVEVRLVLLREKQAAAVSFRVRNGNWEEVRAALKRVVYDGATNLASFTVPAQDVEECLLFSDGIGNFGERRTTIPGVPVYTISSGTRTDPAWLRHLARKSGGRHIDLLSLNAVDAARLLLERAPVIAALTGDGTSDLVAASPHPEHGRILVAGRMRTASATISVGMNGTGPQQALRVAVGPQTPSSPYAAFMWASMRIAEMDGEYWANRDAIRRIGRAFGVVTRETSLIVLDRIEDYVRFEIRPPAELVADYERLITASRQRIASDKRNQIERVVRFFADKQAWWERAYPKDDRPAQISKPTGPDARDQRLSSEAAGFIGALTAPRPPAPPAARMAEARATAEAPASSAPAASIQLRRWTADAPYIKRFTAAAANELYSIYLEERGAYSGSTAFILDAADQLLEKGQKELGLRVLSNLAEMDLENRHILRVLGYRLLQAGEARLALPIFERVLELSPEEPQSYRDLGLAYAADHQFQKAVDTLYEVVQRPWHGRFPEIELVALAELNAIAARADRAGTPVDLARVDPRLRRNLTLDIRVIATWDADNTDIDLWVTDPNGEKAYYGHRHTYQGGRMSPDYTGGYGPEEFSLRDAKPGRYIVQVNFYGHRQQIVAGATTLQVKFITGFGTAREQERIVTLRLRERQEVVTVGEFNIRGTAQ
jgi:tetratricopeptide (TPR) repeat protein